MSKAIYASIASLVIGAAGGWSAHTASPVADLERSTASGSSTTSVLRSFTAAHEPSQSIGADMQLLRSMMREEISAALAAQHGNQPAMTVSPMPASPEVVAQREIALQDIESMISGSQWGNEQRQAFQQRIAMLDPDQAQRALHDVTVALNEGTIRVTTDGPPM